MLFQSVSSCIGTQTHQYRHDRSSSHLCYLSTHTFYLRKKKSAVDDGSSDGVCDQCDEQIIIIFYIENKAAVTLVVINPRGIRDGDKIKGALPDNLLVKERRVEEKRREKRLWR